MCVHHNSTTQAVDIIHRITLELAARYFCTIKITHAYTRSTEVCGSEKLEEMPLLIVQLIRNDVIQSR